MTAYRFFSILMLKNRWAVMLKNLLRRRFLTELYFTWQLDV